MTTEALDRDRPTVNKTRARTFTMRGKMSYQQTSINLPDVA